MTRFKPGDRVIILPNDVAAPQGPGTLYKRTEIYNEWMYASDEIMPETARFYISEESIEPLVHYNDIMKDLVNEI